MIDPRIFPDATDLARSIAAGARSSLGVIDEHTRRIQSHHNELNAAIDTFGAAATDIAEEQAATNGPLAGVPISVKETYGLAGEPVTAGSVRAPSYVPEEDAVAVQRLKAAGAIVLARGNVPEFAMTHETTNLRYGTTNNPLAPDRTPGGSSGGDAALVASGGVAIGMGSDLGGSIRYPAHCCGVVGFKPASGHIDPTGTWPPRDPGSPDLFADTMMSLGPLTRSVRDARLVYRIVADDPIEPSEVDAPRLVVPEAFAHEIREGVIRNALASARAALTATGAPVETARLPDAGQVYSDFLNVIIRDYNRFFWKGMVMEDGTPLRVPAELWRQATGQPTVHWHFFRLLAGMQIIRPRNGAAEHSQARLMRDRRRIRDILGTDGLLLLPTNGALAMKHGQASAYMARPGVRPLFTPTVFVNALNLPAISIPAWTHRDRATGLVPGVQLACTPGAEDLLFRAAARLESALRRPVPRVHAQSSTPSESRG